MSVRKRVADRHHKWLSYVESTGIVLSEPVLAEKAPAGFRAFEKKEIAQFYRAKEVWELPKGMAPDGQAQWISYILEEMLGLSSEDWLTGSAIPEQYTARLVAQGETLRPTRVLVQDNNALMLFWQVPREQGLDKAWANKGGGWKASPCTKMERLLRETTVEVGLLTNGEEWRLVIASPSETAAWMSWKVQTWADALSTLFAFADLLGAPRLLAGDINEAILELVRQSRKRQMDIADQLGHQVREALRLFAHELDKIDHQMDGELLSGWKEADIYEACVKLMMRLIFLLYAEENGLLPHGNVTYDNSFGLIHLLNSLEEQNRYKPERLQLSFEAYSRLLALFRLIHQGSPDPDLLIAAHGGRLFDPDLFPLLEGRLKDCGWPKAGAQPLPICDTVVREMLRSLKYARGEGGINHLVSYSTLSVEQIGAMYEGLLDIKLVRAPADDPVFEIISNDRDLFATVKGSEIDGLYSDTLLEVVTGKTDKAQNAIEKLLQPPGEFDRIPELGTDDLALLGKAEPIKRLVKPRGIVRPGGLYLSKGEERRSTGTHYTPPELTEPVVRHTLEPLVHLGENGKLEEPLTVKSARELLDLKVCDMAMGSGAFLVQALRYLSAKLVEAWDKSMAENPGALLTLPYADQATGDSKEHLMPGSGQENGNGDVDSRAELGLWAKRYVAIHCIYGVDINALAVEMAKLSLWIETHSKGKPFTFLDHSLRCGDSLVGVDQEQLRTWSLDRNGKANRSLYDPETDKLLQKAVKLRIEIAEMPAFSAKDVIEKTKKLQEADDALELLKLGGDLIVASHFGTEKPKERKELLGGYQLKYFNLMTTCFKSFNSNNLGLQEKYSSLKMERQKILKTRKPFHWHLEFPEIIGFNAIIGNPPYLWGMRISTLLGEDLLRYLEVISNRKFGTADYCVHFLNKSFVLIKPKGTLGLILVDTVAQGDSREAGLGVLLHDEATIYRAISSIDWPGTASVKVAIVNLYKGSWLGFKFLENTKVENIDSRLVDAIEENKPVTISSNKGMSYVGHYPMGQGFEMSFDETNEVLNQYPNYKEVLFPYLKGEDVNQTIDQKHRCNIINFNDMSLEQCKLKYPVLTNRIELLVKPGRDKQKRKQNREKWWQYAEKRPGLMKVLGKRQIVLVQPFTTKYLTFTFTEACQAFAHPMLVIDTSDYALFCVLQSAIHELWVIKYSSKMGNRIRYASTDCFETFPFPEDVVIGKNKYQKELLEMGCEYYNLRKNIMQSKSLNITGFYNKIHDERCDDEFISNFRDLIVEMNLLVIKSYFWNDISPSYSFSGTPLGIRYSLDEESKKNVLRKLLNLNLHQILSD